MRTRRVASIAALLVVFWGAGAALGRWESERDNKSEAELAQLDERKLFEEAFDVCVRRAVLAKGPRGGATEATVAAAEEYLLRIEATVRQKTGTVPGWLRDLSFARSTKDCQNVFRAFLSGETAPETKPAPVTPGVSETMPTGIPRATPRPTPASAQKPVPKKMPNGPRWQGVPPTPTRVIRVPAFPLLWETPTPARVAPLPPPGTLKGAASPRAKGTGVAPERAVPGVAAPTRPPLPSPRTSEEVTDELPPWFR